MIRVESHVIRMGFTLAPLNSSLTPQKKSPNSILVFFHFLSYLTCPLIEHPLIEQAGQPQWDSGRVRRD